MPRRSLTPLQAVARGGLAGLAGAGAMTAAQTAVMKAQDGEPSSTPGEVAKRIVEGVFQREVPEERMPLLNNGMHYLYGTGWGVAYGIVAGDRRPRWPRGGLALAATAWAVSLIALPAMRLAPPPWEYPPSQLGQDAGYHVVYGLSAGAVLALLGPGGAAQ